MVLRGRSTDTTTGGVRCRSRISGALGDISFEAGDMIEVPASKLEEWLAAGLIDPPPTTLRHGEGDA